MGYVGGKGLILLFERREASGETVSMGPSFKNDNGQLLTLLAQC